MKWEASPPALVAWFDTLVEGLPAIERRKMFGYPAVFVDGKLVGGLYQDRMVLKLPAAAREELFALNGATPFEPRPGQRMGEFVLISASWMQQTEKLRPWLDQALCYVKSLPGKTAKKKGRSTINPDKKPRS
jgi:TfoX/Sxy family transcriptional regulator of competence genes